MNGLTLQEYRKQYRESHRDKIKLYDSVRNAKVKLKDKRLLSEKEIYRSQLYSKKVIEIDEGHPA